MLQPDEEQQQSCMLSSSSSMRSPCVQLHCMGASMYTALQSWQGRPVLPSLPLWT